VLCHVLSEQEMDSGLNVKLKVVRVSFLSARRAETSTESACVGLRCLIQSVQPATVLVSSVRVLLSLHHGTPRLLYLILPCKVMGC